MAFRPAGLLLDTIFDNTGDKAIRLAMEDFCQERGIAYEVLNPLAFDPRDYARLVVGGGHLIRDPDDGYYDRFRVAGPHILNTVGVSGSRKMDYLREYEYVSVRSTADRDRLAAAVPDAAVVPCVSMSLKGEEADVSVHAPTLGLQLSPAALPVCAGIEKTLSTIDLPKLFVPVMHYADDRTTMEQVAAGVPGSAVAPYLQPRQVLSLIARLRAFVSCSLHGSIFAYANNVPFLAFNHAGTTKIEEFMRDRGLEEWLFRDGEELAKKLLKLLDERPDYAELIARDMAAVRGHFDRMESVLKQAGVVVPGPAETDGTAADMVRRLQARVQERDLETARLRDEDAKALRERDAEVESLGHQVAHQEQRLGEKEKQIASMDGLIRRKDRAIAQKDTHIANIETALLGASQAVAALSADLEMTKGSIGWRLLEALRKPIRLLAPPGSAQRLPLVLLKKSGRIILREGWWAFLKRAVRVWRWLPNLRRTAAADDGLSLNDQYQLWLKANAITPERERQARQQAEAFAYKPLVSIVVPVYNPEETWLREAIESVRSQIYENWELCLADDASTRRGVRTVLKEYARLDARIKVTLLEKNVGIAEASNAALSLATGEFVGLLDHDDELKPEALFEVVKLFNENADLDYIYSDEDKKEADGRLVEPFFKPDWSPDLLTAVNYVTHFSVFRREVIERAGGFRKGYDGSQDYDLVLRVTEMTDRIAHIARPLYSWRKVPGSAAAAVRAKDFALRAAKKALKDALSRRGFEGEVEKGLAVGRYRVRYETRGTPKVSIIIPTRDRADMLRRCIESIRKKSTYKNYEIVVVDNDSREQETLDYLASFKGRVVRYPHAFNFAAIINTAAREAGGEYLLLLNNDTEVITPGWIEALLEHAQRPEVAAAGARLLYPDGRVQHEGIIMNLGGGSAGNVDHGGYFGLGECTRNCTAVTGACMMVRKSVFWELGGFDEQLRVAFNDVDFCLRAREKGYWIVYTPYATLYHDESASRGSLHPDEDEQLFRKRWGKPGEFRDPYYNSNLDLRYPFTIRVE